MSWEPLKLFEGDKYILLQKLNAWEKDLRFSFYLYHSIIVVLLVSTFCCVLAKAVMRFILARVSSCATAETAKSFALVTARVGGFQRRQRRPTRSSRYQAVAMWRRPRLRA
jgi:hypothetical protein